MFQIVYLISIFVPRYRVSEVSKRFIQYVHQDFPWLNVAIPWRVTADVT